ncbi:DEAD/DEAH box helicase family protein, partial [Methanobrevibacter sp.]|uniref:DEAD/DEAH box helicase family protein n=1 Tax=Methanobrevibacter sp. TaxID=66852 RepID=UPI003867FC1E
MELRDYQLEAIGKMKNGCILNGGVGSGKSLTSLSYYYLQNGGSFEFLSGKDYIPMPNPPKDLYIITTARKRDTFEWEGEMSHFLLSTHEELNKYDNKVIVDSWNNIQKYKDVEDAFFIFDEQRVVGSGAWVKAFLKIAKQNQWILLSATPGDTWSDYIPVFIANGFYKNKTEFMREHAVFSRFSKYPKIEKYIGTGRLIRQRREILVDMKFERETVQHHYDIYVTYDTKLYKDVMKRRWDIWNDEPIINASGLCYALRKIVNSHESRSTKLLELFETHQKMIVFYNFDYELEILKSLYFGEGVIVAEWNGHKHEPTPTGNQWVYLVQYTAGAEGWNCIT